MLNQCQATSDWFDQAPDEAEAELAALSRHGIIDAVLTTDIDALVFSATCVICW